MRPGTLYPTLGSVAPGRTACSSVTRALRVVETVAAAGDGVTAKAVARRLGVPLPSIYRMLGTLVDEGYLVRLNDVRGYGLGYRVGELHRTLTDQLRPPATLRALVHEVHASARAAAYLAVLRDVAVVVAYVDDCADHPRPAPMRVGEPTPAHATAAGKVVLAGLQPGRLAELVGSAGTSLTVAGRRALDWELECIRADGAAVAAEEYGAGVAGVAAPVAGPGGETSGALGVSVPRADFAVRRPELEQVVRRAAARASAGH